MMCKCGHNKFDHMAGETAKPARCLNGLSSDAIMRSWINNGKILATDRGTCACDRFAETKECDTSPDYPYGYFPHERVKR
jgi:hypothetical protein